MSTIPNAWDDDEYPTAADGKGKQAAAPTQSPTARPSRAERRAHHEQANRQLWNSAENPETFHFMEARTDLPLKSDFKPTVKLLSRKPKPVASPSAGLQGGVANLQLNDEDDSEEEARKVSAATFEARREQARLERIEKEKRYAEVRERLFGSPASPAPAATKGDAGTGGRARRSGRGGKRGDRSANASRQHSAQTSSADQSPVRQGPASTKQLFDAASAEKPGSTYQQWRSQISTSMDMEKDNAIRPMRAPRGPDANGSGGFGSRRRGGQEKT